MRIAVTLLAAAAALAQTVAAQPGAPATPAIYSTSTSFHVPDETRIAYEEWLKGKFRRLVEGMMKEDPSLQSVNVSRVIFGGVKEPEANFYVTYFSQGVPKNRTDIQNKVAKQLFGQTYAEFQKEAAPLRKRLGQILGRRMAGTAPTAAEGDLLRIDFKRIEPGRMGDYVQLERGYQRLREAQVKAGKMKGWSMSTLVLPAGTDRPFDAWTTHTVKDLEQSLNWGQGGAAIAAQLDPPFNLMGSTMRANELSKTVRGETRLVVMVVRRP
jgi:hypothetical protein